MGDEIDKIIKGEITNPESMKDICEGIDVVFSSIGITRQKDILTFKDVDYQGNKNLLEIAKKAGVKKLIYVSVFNGMNLKHLAIVKAHEDFVDELKSSGIDYTVIRPTGYFSDMEAFFNMAKKGRVYLFGPGNNRMNPIHGADLAKVCVDAMQGENREIDIGGPETYTYKDISRMAFDVQEKPEKISSVPVWIMNLLISVTKLFNRHQGELLAFFTTAGTNDTIAPATGVRTLKEHYRTLL